MILNLDSFHEVRALWKLLLECGERFQKDFRMKKKMKKTETSSLLFPIDLSFPSLQSSTHDLPKTMSAASTRFYIPVSVEPRFGCKLHYFLQKIGIQQ